jgi:hypothetical protein
MTTPTPRTHEWVSFADDDGDDWLFDVTFLASNWMCIFGDGCLGVLEVPTPEDEQGCCSYGAHLADDADLERVRTAAARLDATTWQHIALAEARGGPFKRQGDDTVSRLVDGACIFLNRPGFAGGAGCALHLAALEAGESPIEWKPSVCWQLPLRVDWVDVDGHHETATVRRWTRADWGDHGTTMAWCCTERSDGGEAYCGDEQVVDSLADPLRTLAGDEVYVTLRRTLREAR